MSGLQKFVGAAPWAYDDVMAERGRLFAEELVPSTAGSPIGVVGVIDESSFTRRGRTPPGCRDSTTAGSARRDNCQVGVFLIGVTPAGQALLDHRLFLPESWCADTPEAKRRRDAAHVPEGVTFRTKPQIAAELVRNVAVLGQAELDWVVGDSEYGRAGHLLDELELLEQRYVLEIPKRGCSGHPTRRAASRGTQGGVGSRPPRRGSRRAVVEIAHALPARRG